MKRRSQPKSSRARGTYGAKLRGERGPMMYGPTKHSQTHGKKVRETEVPHA